MCVFPGLAEPACTSRMRKSYFSTFKKLFKVRVGDVFMVLAEADTYVSMVFMIAHLQDRPRPIEILIPLEVHGATRLWDIEGGENLPWSLQLRRSSLGATDGRECLYFQFGIQLFVAFASRCSTMSSVPKCSRLSPRHQVVGNQKANVF